jgi:hypothetical protein
LSGTDGNIPAPLDLINQTVSLSIPGDTQVKKGGTTSNYSGVISMPISLPISSVNNQHVIAAFNV